MGKIVALGGGVFMGKREDRFPAEMRHTHEEIIRLTGKQHPKVLYFPTAANDSEKRIKDFTKYYTDLGCEVDTLRLLKQNPSRLRIRQAIGSADAVFVTGGNTFRTINTWKRYQIDTLLKQAYERGTVMSGFSAGAICWFKYGNSDSFSKKRLFRVTGLGIFDALICPHYDSEPHRQGALKKMMKRTHGMVAVALDEYVGLEIVDDRYRILASKPAAKARRIYWKRGEYIIEEVPVSREFKSLDSLLTKP